MDYCISSKCKTCSLGQICSLSILFFFQFVFSCSHQEGCYKRIIKWFVLWLIWCTKLSSSFNFTKERQQADVHNHNSFALRELLWISLISREFLLKSSVMSFSFDSRVPSESEGFLKNVNNYVSFWRSIWLMCLWPVLWAYTSHHICSFLTWIYLFHNIVTIKELQWL